MESSTVPVEISAENPPERRAKALVAWAFHGLNKGLCNRAQPVCLHRLGLNWHPSAGAAPGLDRGQFTVFHRWACDRRVRGLLNPCDANTYRPWGGSLGRIGKRGILARARVKRRCPRVNPRPLRAPGGPQASCRRSPRRAGRARGPLRARDRRRSSTAPRA